MKKLFKKLNKSTIINGKRFLSIVDFFELNTFCEELQNKNPSINSDKKTTAADDILGGTYVAPACLLL